MNAIARKDLLVMAGLLALVALMWLNPVLTLRLTDQPDIPTHLRWAEQFAVALKEGIWFPRWASASLDGLGDPTFVYYQPLFYYLTGTASLLGARSELALVLAATVPFLILGIVVYGRIFRAYHTPYAIAATLFIVAAPPMFFLSTQVGAFPWTLSVPFSVLFAIESIRQRPRIAPLALLLCLICLSHLLSGLITLCGVGLSRVLFAFPTQRNLVDHLRWGAGVVLGLALAAFFIYPAVTQLHLINPVGWVGGEFAWRTAYALPIWHAHLGVRWFAIQWVLALVVLMTIVLALIPGSQAGPGQSDRLARCIGIMSLVLFAFSTELTAPLYELLSPLRKVQFPYRFVFLAGILANIALAIKLSEGYWQRCGKLIRTAILGLIAIQFALTGYMQLNLHRNGERLPDRASFMSGRFGAPEYHPAVRGEHWRSYVEQGKLAGECRKLAIQCTSVRQRSHDFDATISTDKSVFVRLPIFAYPAWSVNIDGVDHPLEIDRPTGLVSVSLTPGTHRVSITWAPPPAEVTGVRLTWCALVVLLVLMMAKSLSGLQRRFIKDSHAGSALQGNTSN